MGCETEDDGDGKYTDWQLWAMPRVHAAQLRVMGRDETWYCSHRTWAPYRKIDPAGISDEWMRKKIRDVLQEGDMPNAKEIADAVWGADTIPNPNGKDRESQTRTPRTTLADIEATQDEMRHAVAALAEAVKAQGKTLQAITTALSSLRVRT